MNMNNMLFIKYFLVGFMVSETPRVSVFGHCPYLVTFPYIRIYFVTRIKEYIMARQKQLK